MENIEESKLNEVSGGAAKRTMLVCSACKYTLDPEKVAVTIMPGEMTECPRCHEVAMTLKQI